MCLFYNSYAIFMLLFYQDDFSEKVEMGEIIIEGRKDVLAIALDKEEHMGRVRGTGHRVTISSHFGSKKSNRSNLRPWIMTNL